MDIVVWLRSLGLGRYEATFRENEIDETVLPSLTHETLKELGVTAVGHRLKLLDAIAALRSDASGKKPSIDAATTSSAPSSPPEDRAERRQVTVMFSDLVGSTALSARMDPEDLREVISAYQKCVARTVERFGGFVAKYMGDGVLIYFGYPRAHEDDTEQAVRAGLELGPAVGGLKTHAALQTRVGIATGLVVVGDLIGSGASQEQAIVGDTPNLAARLQHIAEPNGVVIAESTRKLVGDLFELDDLGGQDLKGIAGSVRAWAALRPSSVESRFEALHMSGLTELVGREEELELLLRRWSKAKAGEGQVVLLSGEPGIGKSRLTAALLERLADEPHTRLRYFCSPQHTDSALYPVISQMQRAAGFTHEDTAEAKLNKLDVLLSQSLAPRHEAALLADMLSLPNDGRYPILDLMPEQRRLNTLAALTAQLEALSRSKPVLMIFEDVHWIDPTSLETLSQTVDRVRTRAVLVIVTYRPEFEAPWIGRPHVTALSLNRLGDREIDALIGRVSGNKALPASVRQDIVERTDGIPLFVEEMTKAVLEAKGEGEAAEGRVIAAIPSPSAAVPASLHASLLARLDRLGSAKEVAQVGAAIGREFSHSLLAEVVRKPEGELNSALSRLVAAGLLFRQGVPPHASYLFKHALVQDAAYGTLLREARRMLHAHIAEVLESKFDEIAENQPELLARHCADAGLIEKAANLWGKAGQRSLERSALVEATKQLTRAVDQIASLTATPTLRREQIKLQIALANALMHTKGHASPDTRAALDQARALIDLAQTLGEPLEDALLLFSTLYGVWVTNLVAFKGEEICALAAHFLALADQQRAQVPLMIGHRLMGNSLLYCGDATKARTHFDQALALYDPDKHGHLAMQFGYDVEVATLSYRGLALWVLGYPDAALRDADRAAKDARLRAPTIGNMFVALTPGSWPQIYCGNYKAANGQADETIALADKSASLWKAGGILNRGCMLALTGTPFEAIQIISSGIASLRSMNQTLWLPLFLSSLAGAHAQVGQFHEGWRCVDEAVSMLQTTGERWCEADVYRIAGEIARLSPTPDVAKAQTYFEQALVVARAQQAKSWELRASMSLARLWRDQGKVPQARELLAPVYGWFTEGFDTRDLKEAKALLEGLA